jgi:hypothetical protein
MKKIILLAGIAMLAGSAQAQMRSSGMSSSSGSLSFSHPSHGTPAPPPQANVSATNPGEFVPSTFESYNEAVITGQEQLNARPVTVAEAARIFQAQRKSESQKPALIVEQDDNGRMVISSGKQQELGKSN